MITSTSPNVILASAPRESSVTCQFPDGRRVTLTAGQWADVQRGAKVSPKGGIYWPDAAELRRDAAQKAADDAKRRRVAELRRKHHPTKQEAAGRYPKFDSRYAELSTEFHRRYSDSPTPVAVGLACRYYEPWTDAAGRVCVFHPGSLTLADRPVVRVCHHRALQLKGAGLRIERDIETGLWATVHLPDTKLGQAVAASMKCGRLCAFSVGIDADDKDSTITNGVREIHAATVKEISLCHQGRVASCTASLYGADQFAGKRGSVRAVLLRDWLESEISKADAARGWHRR